MATKNFRWCKPMVWPSILTERAMTSYHIQKSDDVISYWSAHSCQHKLQRQHAHTQPREDTGGVLRGPLHNGTAVTTPIRVRVLGIH